MNESAALVDYQCCKHERYGFTRKLVGVDQASLVISWMDHFNWLVEMFQGFV
jgi:hypothetical protein